MHIYVEFMYPFSYAAKEGWVNNTYEYGKSYSTLELVA
jgi:hypothetical protein